MISVIINTFSRAERLRQALQGYEEQTLGSEAFELVIVDDGSTDATPAMLDEYERTSRLRILRKRQENAGPAVARNAGLDLAGGEWIVFVGDDIVPTADFLEKHQAAHAEHDNDVEVAVAGHTRWWPEIKLTPFLRYIGDYGPQFAYGLVPGRGFVPRTLFYTSNVSLHRDLLDRLDAYFDSIFRFAAYEDVDIAYRLEKVGMKLFYEPAAIAFHNHPMSVSSFAARQLMVGRSYHFLEQKFGSLASDVSPKPSWTFLLGHLPWLQSLMKMQIGWTDRCSVRLPNAVYSVFLLVCFSRGYVDGVR